MNFFTDKLDFIFDIFVINCMNKGVFRFSFIFSHFVDNSNYLCQVCVYVSIYFLSTVLFLY